MMLLLAQRSCPHPPRPKEYFDSPDGALLCIFPRAGAFHFSGVALKALLPFLDTPAANGTSALIIGMTYWRGIPLPMRAAQSVACAGAIYVSSKLIADNES